MSTHVSFNVVTGKKVETTLSASMNANPSLEQMRTLFENLKMNDFASLYHSGDENDTSDSSDDGNESDGSLLVKLATERVQKIFDYSLKMAGVDTSKPMPKLNFPGLTEERLKQVGYMGLQPELVLPKEKNVKKTNGKKVPQCVTDSPPFGGGDIQYTFSRGDDPHNPNDIVVHLTSTVPITNIKAEMTKQIPPSETGFEKPISVLEAMMLKAMAMGTFYTEKQIKSKSFKSKQQAKMDRFAKFLMDTRDALSPKKINANFTNNAHVMVNHHTCGKSNENYSVSNGHSHPQLPSYSEHQLDRFNMPDPSEMSPKKKHVDKCSTSKCTNIFCPGNYGYSSCGPPSQSSIHGGELPDDDNLFSSYIEKELSHVSSLSSFGSKVSNVKNYRELYDLVSGCDSAMEEINMFTSYVIDSLEKMPPAKDISLAQSLRNEGNDFYNRKLYMEALHKYNEAIIRSPGPDDDESKELAKCFNNRSLLYYSINRFKECIYDINEAIRCGYTFSGCKNSLITLLKRKIRCYRQLHDQKSIDKLMRTAMKVFKTEDEISDLKAAISNHLDLLPPFVSLTYGQDQMKEKYQIKHKHELMKEVSDAIEMTNEGRRGLRLRAARKILPQEVLVNESTLGAVLLRKYSKERCFYCLKLILCSRIIPCFKCNYSVYCSRKCQSNDWIKSHYIECDLLPILKYFPVGQSIIKLLLTFGIDNVIKIKPYKYQDIPFKKYGNDLRSFFSRDIILPEKHASRINFTMTSILLTNLLITFYDKHYGSISNMNGNGNGCCTSENINNNTDFKSGFMDMINGVADKHGFNVLVNGIKSMSNGDVKNSCVKTIELQRTQSNESSSSGDGSSCGKRSPSCIDTLFCGGKLVSANVRNHKHGPIHASKEKLNLTILKMILIMYDTRDVMIGTTAQAQTNMATSGYGAVGQPSSSPAFYGISVSPIIGLMPICCNANTDVINIGRRTIVSALRVIEKGEEIRVR